MKKYLLIVLLVGVCFGQIEKIVERHPNGVKRLIMHYKGTGSNEQLIRKTTYYDNGRIESSTDIKNGKEHGIYKKWTRNAFEITSYNFLDGKVIKPDEQVFDYSTAEIVANSILISLKNDDVNTFKWFIDQNYLKSIEDCESKDADSHDCRNIHSLNEIFKGWKEHIVNSKVVITKSNFNKYGSLKKYNDGRWLLFDLH
jgi:antitoxin component YwqK of YwqJK toxin-antitoxin module